MTDKEKLELLADMCNIPHYDGMQYMHVLVNINNPNWGEIRFGFNWKSQCGIIEFSDLDEALTRVTQLLKMAVE